MFWHKTPKIIQKSFPGYHWKVPNSDAIHLTFDDGPVPGVTDWVLDHLEPEDIPATFFCVGDNIQKHPDEFQTLINKGHKAGNHTHNHLDGWKTRSNNYLENIARCDRLLPEHMRMFRPPYGRMNVKSAGILKKERAVVMWDILIGDFMANLNPTTVVKRCVKLLEPGSIVLFHDSLKAEAQMKRILPLFIEEALNKGFKFKQLPW